MVLLRLLDRFFAKNRILLAHWVGVHPRVLDRLTHAASR
jgi:hypothetical protein